MKYLQPLEFNKKGNNRSCEERCIFSSLITLWLPTMGIQIQLMKCIALPKRMSMSVILIDDVHRKMTNYSEANSFVF